MSEKITVPTLGESVTEATVSKWLKSQGDKVVADEPIVELETDKVNVEVPAPSNGILGSIAVKEGETVNVGSLLGTINDQLGQEANIPKEIKKYNHRSINLNKIKKELALDFNTRTNLGYMDVSSGKTSNYLDINPNPAGEEKAPTEEAPAAAEAVGRAEAEEIVEEDSIIYY